MFLRWSSFKYVQRIQFHEELWLLQHQKEGSAKTSSPKEHVWFENYFAQMFLGWPSTKVVKIILICKHGHQGAELVFTYMCILIFFFKSSCSKVLAQFENNLAQIVLGWPLYQHCLNYFHSVAVELHWSSRTACIGLPDRKMSYCSWHDNSYYIAQVSDPGPTWPSCL